MSKQNFYYTSGLPPPLPQQQQQPQPPQLPQHQNHRHLPPKNYPAQAPRQNNVPHSQHQSQQQQFQNPCQGQLQPTYNQSNVSTSSSALKSTHAPPNVTIGPHNQPLNRTAQPNGDPSIRQPSRMPPQSIPPPQPTESRYRDLYLGLQSRNDTLNSLNNYYSDTLEEKEKDLKLFQEKEKDCKSQLKSYEQRLSEKSKEIASLRSDEKASAAHYKNLETENKELRKGTEALIQQIEALKKENKLKDKEKEEFECKLKNCKQELSKKENEVETLKREARNSTIQCNILEKDNKELREGEEELIQQLQKLKEENDKVNELIRERAQLKEANRFITKDLGDHIEQVKSANAKCSELEAELDQIKKLGSNKVIDTKSEKKLKGSQNYQPDRMKPLDIESEEGNQKEQFKQQEEEIHSLNLNLSKETNELQAKMPSLEKETTPPVVIRKTAGDSYAILRPNPKRKRFD